ncbi:MAG: hypothetical protein HY699_15040 [Deltaproteobacteria bacterium]|nr:hypothetical protein [Deltaproteobacteria bacterium]
MGVISMLWCAAQSPLPLAVAWPASTWALAAVAVGVAAVLFGLVLYEVLVTKALRRPALRIVEGGRSALQLKPA